MHDREIIQLIKADKQNFALLFDQYFVPVKKYILRRVGNYDISCDIIAETFLKAYLNIEKFEYRGISLKVWIYRIATNEANLYFRSRKYTAVNIESLRDFNSHSLQTTQQEEKEAWEKELEANRNFKQAQHIINRLPIKYAEVLSLRFFENTSIKEIAEILNKPEGTIKSLCARGLAKVREQMQPDSET